MTTVVVYKTDTKEVLAAIPMDGGDAVCRNDVEFQNMIVAKNCNISEDAVKDLAMDHSIIMVRGNGQADVTAYSCGVYYMPEE